MRQRTTGCRIRNAALHTEVAQRSRRKWRCARPGQAGSANRAKSEFLAAVSHELRTPLEAPSSDSPALLSGRSGFKPSADKSLLACRRHPSQRHAPPVADKRHSGSVEGRGRRASISTMRSVNLEDVIVWQHCDRPCPRRCGRHRAGGQHPADLPQLLCGRAQAQSGLAEPPRTQSEFTPDGGTVAVAATTNDDGDLTISIARYRHRNCRRATSNGCSNLRPIGFIAAHASTEGTEARPGAVAALGAPAWRQHWFSWRRTPGAAWPAADAVSQRARAREDKARSRRRMRAADRAPARKNHAPAMVMGTPMSPALTQFDQNAIVRTSRPANPSALMPVCAAAVATTPAHIRLLSRTGQGRDTAQPSASAASPPKPVPAARPADPEVPSRAGLSRPPRLLRRSDRRH